VHVTAHPAGENLQHLQLKLHLTAKLLKLRSRPSQRSRRLNPWLLLSSLLLMATLALPSTTQAAAVPTVTTLLLSSPSVASPAAVTLTASVVPVTVGTVTFCNASATYCEDASIVGRAQLVAGAATITIIPAIGVHTYKAIFSATATAAASTSTTQTLTVTGPLYPTTTTIAASGNSNDYGLTATVTGVASNPPLLTGSVSFQDTSNGNYVLGTASLGTPSFTQSFTQPIGSPVGAGDNAAVAVAADFNGDGKPDLAVMDSLQNAVTILQGNGDGTFTLVNVIYGVGTTPCVFNGQSNCAIAGGDFNHDGHTDLALTSGGDNTVTILLGNGDFTFTAASGSPITVGNFPEAVKVGDFNSDGLLDLAVANANDNTLSILLGNGDGTFTAASGSPISVGAFPFFLAVADFNGDSKSDVAVVNGNDGTVTILLGNGDGTFTPASGSPIAVGNGPCPIVAADFNGDGVVDLAVANFDDSDVVILLGNGDGTFTAGPESPITVGSQPFAMVSGDFNDDGNTDLAVDNYGGQTLTILLGVGNGSFAPPGPVTVLGDSPNDLVAADFNGDGTTDLAIPELGDNDVTILLNYVSQTAVAAVANVTIPGIGTHYVDASYSGNTYFAGSTSAAIPLMGSTAPTTLTLSSSATQQLVTMPLTFTAQLAAVGTPTGVVSFFDGGTLLGTAAINGAGQAVYVTNSLADGLHSITASYAGNSSFLGSTSSTALSITISDLQITLTSGNPGAIVPGASVTCTFQVAPLVATTFLYGVTMTTGGLPAGATAVFAPAVLPAGGQSTTVMLTIQSAAQNGSVSPSPHSDLPLALGLIFPLIAVVPARRRVRRIPGFLALLLLAALSLSAVAGLSGCSPVGFFAQTKTTYAIAVIVTSGTLQRSTNVPLTIQ
jgi:Bacterial Ig-like domain (group 3)/FG-GAP-like repeat/FG-GAP repeat